MNNNEPNCNRLDLPARSGQYDFYKDTGITEQDIALACVADNVKRDRARWQTGSDGAVTEFIELTDVDCTAVGILFDSAPATFSMSDVDWTVSQL